MGWTDRLYPQHNEFQRVTDIQMVARSAIIAPEASHPPVIAISGGASKSKSVTAMMTMVRTLGATPVFIGNHGERIKNGTAQGVAEVLQNADAVIVMGNDGDIDPRTYGAEPVPETKIEQDNARAEFENELIRQSIAQKKPLMGVCGGMQRINVLCGGTLHQHIPKLIGDNHHAQGDYNIPPFIAVQEVNIRAGSALSGMIGQPKGMMVQENSFHHQAVDVVPEGLRVNAVSSDGIAQGIETAAGGKYHGQFILGVQWHPEFAASHIGPKMVGALVDQGRLQAAAYPHAVDQMVLEVENLRSSLPDIAPELQKKFAALVSSPRQPVQGQPGLAI